MQSIPLDLGLGSSPAQDGHAGAARHVNCYVEATPGGKYARQIVACDGFVSFATLADSGAVRCIFAINDSEMLVVAGRRLFLVDQSGAATYIGAIPSDGMVTMARNREAPNPTVAIVCDGAVWFYKGGVLTESSDPDLPPVISVAGLDGYFSFLDGDGRHYASDLDASDVTALSFATAESNPDPGVRNFTRGRDLVFFGTRSVEFWSNEGEDPYPFVRSSARDVGCVAPDSVAELDQTIAWVAHDGTVRKLAGWDAQVIGSQAVHNAIEAETNKHAITGCSWQKRGHTFYALSGTGWTWVYNATTDQWHERKSYGSERWMISRACRFGDKVILGNATEGKLYELQHGAETEAGAHLIATVQTAPVHGFPYRFKHAAAHIDVVPGVATVGKTATLMMRYSDDGGHSWSVQRMFDLGTEGQRLTRVKATRLGVSRSRTYELAVSSDVRRVFLAMTVDAEKLGA